MADFEGGGRRWARDGRPRVSGAYSVSTLSLVFEVNEGREGMVLLGLSVKDEMELVAGGL